MASFGIDFGTTNTSVVECLVTEHAITKTPWGQNNQPFPSLVALHAEKPPVFGWDVKKRRSQLNAEGYHVVASFKTILGTDQSIAVGGNEYSPVDVTALFLSYVKSKVEEMAGRELKEAVMAIPVDFSPEQRKDLRSAAKKAGIRVKSFVSEPTAAYVSTREELGSASNLAVFDWGGGTLDISLISVEGHEVSELAISGQRLGGNDIDLLIAKHLHARIGRQVGDSRSYEDISPEEKDKILDRSEDAKKRLSTDETAPVRLMRYAGKPLVQDFLTLDEFTKLIAAKVEDAIRLLFETADKAGVSLGQMDAILMVGGSCEMQPIYRQIEKIGEEYHLLVFRPEAVQWAVAGGAAILSELQPSYQLQKGFGVVLADDSFFPVLQAGQTIPCKTSELSFGVVEDTTSANFIFADANKNVYERLSVPIKGFTPEGIHLQCYVDDDMIVHIRLFSDYAEKMAVESQLNKLSFSYKIG